MLLQFKMSLKMQLNLQENTCHLVLLVIKKIGYPLPLLPLTTRFFSHLKTIKTKLRCSLNTSTLCDWLEICIEGPYLQNFDVNSAIDVWWKDSNTTRRLNQQQQKAYLRRRYHFWCQITLFISSDDFLKKYLKKLKLNYNCPKVTFVTT